LKDDYIPSQIFTTSFIILILYFIGLMVADYFTKYKFWIPFLSIIVGFFVGVRKSRIKTFEALDAFVYAFLSAIILTSIILINTFDLTLFIFYLISFTSLASYLLLKKQYKTFLWYKSGRRGFPGLFAIGLFFLERAIISIVMPELVLFLTEYDIFISGLISLMSFLNIFILAGR